MEKRIKKIKRLLTPHLCQSLSQKSHSHVALSTRYDCPYFVDEKVEAQRVT